ncbi:MAG: OmpW/AlkL family protein [Sphingomonadaceae bacterium]
MKFALLAGSAALAAAFALGSTPALAQDEDQGPLQVKVLATAVLPDGKIKRVNTDIVGLPAATQTEANNNVVPTVAIEYFFSNNFSVETICCMTQHDVDAVAGLPAGAELVSDAKVIPATFTAKFHFDLGGIKPYVGAGPTYFIWINEKPGAATIPLGVTRFKMSNELGIALQAGADIPINDKGMAISLDAKKYFVDTTARWFAGNTLAIETVHKVDPWVLSVGLALRF